jgi:hypothetical protein
VFIPHTQPNDPEQWRLLILDGHKSYTTPEFMTECLMHKIWITFLPAHTSHVLQPCDLGLFSSIKPLYRRKLQLTYAINMESFPGKPEFLEAYSRVRNEVSKPKNIKAGCLASGIYPKDRRKALNSRYVWSSGETRTPGPLPLIPRLSTPYFATGLSPIIFSTPKSSQDVWKIAQDLRDVDPLFSQPVARQLFHKLGKGLDQQIVQSTAIEARNESLQHAMDSCQGFPNRSSHSRQSSGIVAVSRLTRRSEGRPKEERWSQQAVETYEER